MVLCRCNTPLLKGIFQSKVTIIAKERNISTSHKIKNLSCTKVRFDSTARPLARACLHWEALLAAAQVISRRRRGKPESRVAEDFLDFMSEERLLLLAMMSDAMDEALLHLRHYDRDEVDPADLPFHNERFLQRIALLFCGDNPQCFTCGFTKHVVDTLKERPIVLVVQGGTYPKTIGSGNLNVHPIHHDTISSIRPDFQMSL